MIAVLTALSASAAAGMRIALPLLSIGLLRGSQWHSGENLWFNVPLLSCIPTPVVFGILTTWSLLEIFASKKLLGLRLLQLVQLLFSPVVGAMIGIGVTQATEVSAWVIGLVGGALAFVLQLVHTGWFYHLGRLPLWAIFLQDGLSVALVFLAIHSPLLGGLIALVLLCVYIPYSIRIFRIKGI